MKKCLIFVMLCLMVAGSSSRIAAPPKKKVKQGIEQKIKQEKKQLSCAICLEEVDQDSYYSCPHSEKHDGVCAVCLVQGIEFNQTSCPTCRQKWTGLQGVFNTSAAKNPGNWWVRLRQQNFSSLPKTLDVPNHELSIPYQAIYEADFSYNNLKGAKLKRLHDAPKLARLFLSQCQMKRIPEAFAGCQALSTLDLSNNGITALALNHLYKLHSLQDLDLSYNNFHFLPKQFLKCQLVRLILDGNHLSPKSIKNISKHFSKLVELSLRDCGLELFNLDLAKLPKLKKLDIGKNSKLLPNTFVTPLFVAGFYPVPEKVGCWVRTELPLSGLAGKRKR